MKGILDRVYENAPVYELDSESRIIIFSDIHMGDGGDSDDFRSNAKIYLKILKCYYRKKFILILLGDIEELWEDNLDEVALTYKDIFKLHHRFDVKGRLIRVVGNHDIFLEEKSYVKKMAMRIKKKGTPELIETLPFPPILQGLRLVFEGQEFFLFHGHQLDYMSNALWKISRFVVRYFWKPIQIILRVSSSSPSKIHRRRNKLEEKYYHWAERRGKIVICGHTHRAMFASRVGKEEGGPRKISERIQKPIYFNTGCGIYTDYRITGIEINREKMSLLSFHIEGERLRRDILASASLQEIVGWGKKQRWKISPEV